jgi:hypothetical protein
MVDLFFATSLIKKMLVPNAIKTANKEFIAIAKEIIPKSVASKYLAEKAKYMNPKIKKIILPDKTKVIF